MRHLSTVEEIHKIFNTSGSNPLLVTCNDLEEWVCKYDRFPEYLFNELIAAEFARLWKINVPETALIEVKKEHIPTHKYPKLNLSLFDKDCFGSKFLNNSIDVNATLIPSLEDKKFSKKSKIKKIFSKSVYLTFG